MKEELKELFEYVQNLHLVSERWLKAMNELQEPAEEDTEVLFNCFHSS
jgi:hypothetical protein